MLTHLRQFRTFLELLFGVAHGTEPIGVVETA
jgi:hypothetical protein